ncbi:MAG: 1,6-dihydroxycyclohexa-2,4-diene-1-carboxylate dehydrogenase [Zoogloea sp.]|jgi:dihydroxycyclohexadiene carboxylate dehydrogenase|uniref:1,6-dihydroxycyclohexa-2,4-diene-1-carboxylate dehydrogenase n=1 Tax=Zoogloea sp. TaxID=49181 RepID=UPI0026183985|nr:1,6-dihydroxycyclohexa-2,4-diene-1-carboxylate dehydrogenase [Zoogloea sp.]MBL0285192.1 1,6-dihydroxycyclohexa-2,4-diene-1-carboxylate dehydrogenase [Zoogloea sp.]
MSRADRFQNKVVIVTGAAQGIGRGVALNVAAEGGSVLAVDRSELVNEVVAEITAAGGVAAPFQADLETYAGAQAVVAEALARFKRVDVLINNVGGTIWAKPFEHYEEAQIEAEVRRSLFPTLWCCRAVLPTMIAQQSGVIVNVSSVATRGMHRVPYSAAKGGVNALTAALAMENAQHGIRVNATAPGGTDAPPRRVPRNQQQVEQTAQEKAWYQVVIDQTVDSSLMHRYGTIDEQVAPILFFASDEASYVTGSILPVAGGDLG